jgi:hypothetical protein
MQLSSKFLTCSVRLFCCTLQMALLSHHAVCELHTLRCTPCSRVMLCSTVALGQLTRLVQHVVVADHVLSARITFTTTNIAGVQLATLSSMLPRQTAARCAPWDIRPVKAWTKSALHGTAFHIKASTCTVLVLRHARFCAR